MNKYQTLVRILDQLRKEAPLNYKRYYPTVSDKTKIDQARSRTYIHLFLKVKFGLVNFEDREHLITDGTQDGGIDAYYIDSETNKVYFIQSKFRTNEVNFETKNIDLSELLNMDIDRITEGETQDEKQVDYNGKINQLQKELSEIPDIGRYKYQIIILANVKDISDNKLRKLTGGFPADIFDYNKTFNELVLPVIKGTYYNPSELKIYINLTNNDSSGAKISYRVKTTHTNCDITILFVPTIEIAQILYKYKNSILKYNPRSYLELKNNTVNKDIASTITDLSTNEFALFNNGITMLSYGTDFNEKIGQKDKAQLVVTQPQESEFNTDNTQHLKLLETVSKATNQQTPVKESDRRSNDAIQIEFQNKLYDEYGYFYERKKGEYADGIKAGYIDRNQIIDRVVFLQICKCCDFNASDARNTSEKKLFSENNFNSTLYNIERHKEYFFAFKCYQSITELGKDIASRPGNKYGADKFGNALRYGKFSVVTACMLSNQQDYSLDIVEDLVTTTLSKWLAFENSATRHPMNKDYFRTEKDDQNNISRQTLNFDGYYKGKTVNIDLNRFFRQK